MDYEREECYATMLPAIFHLGRCLCDNWKHSFLPRLIFNWRTSSSKLQHVGDVSEQKLKCGPIRYEVSNWKRNFMEIVNCGYIRTQEIGGARLQEKLYARGGKRITVAFAF